MLYPISQKSVSLALGDNRNKHEAPSGKYLTTQQSNETNVLIIHPGVEI